jgi:hypothetical protein
VVQSDNATEPYPHPEAQRVQRHPLHLPRPRLTSPGGGLGKANKTEWPRGVGGGGPRVLREKEEEGEREGARASRGRVCH